MDKPIQTGLHCECCGRKITNDQIMEDGFTVCCGANTLSGNGEVVVKPQNPFKK